MITANFNEIDRHRERERDNYYIINYAGGAFNHQHFCSDSSFTVIDLCIV